MKTKRNLPYIGAGTTLGNCVGSLCPTGYQCINNACCQPQVFRNDFVSGHTVWQEECSFHCAGLQSQSVFQFRKEKVIEQTLIRQDNCLFPKNDERADKKLREQTA